MITARSARKLRRREWVRGLAQLCAQPFTKGFNLQAVASWWCYNCQDKPSTQKRKLFHKVQWACVHSRWRNRQNGTGEWAKLPQFPSVETLAWTAYPASLSTCFVKWGCQLGPALFSNCPSHFWGSSDHSRFQPFLQGTRLRLPWILQAQVSPTRSRVTSLTGPGFSWHPHSSAYPLSKMAYVHKCRCECPLLMI